MNYNTTVLIRALKATSLGFVQVSLNFCPSVYSFIYFTHPTRTWNTTRSTAFSNSSVSSIQDGTKQVWKFGQTIWSCKQLYRMCSQQDLLRQSYLRLHEFHTYAPSCEASFYKILAKLPYLLLAPEIALFQSLPKIHDRWMKFVTETI